MKKILNIAIPASLLTGLIIFWLVPALNSAPQTYQRVYENTSIPATTVNDTTRKVTTSKKVFSEEKLPTMKKLKELDPEMFSRATHYHPAEELDSLLEVYEVVEETEVVVVSDSVVEVVMEEVVLERGD
jgi:hypothetical protein